MKTNKSHPWKNSFKDNDLKTQANDVYYNGLNLDEVLEDFEFTIDDRIELGPKYTRNTYGL